MRNSTLSVINDNVISAKKQGIAQLYTEDQFFDGKNITIGGKSLINFGSCSYLGLEIDQRLKDAAIDAIQRYGIQFSCSRTFLSCTLYTEFEQLLSSIFDAPIVVSTSTSLGHHAVIPVLVGENDVVIMDQQVHASVQDAVLKLKAFGTEVLIARHNDLDDLNKKISEVSSRCDKIWYMIDGVYSMYGDFAPVAEIQKLLETQEKLHVYADDAHGLGWCGKNGRGYILSKMDMHPRMVVATSLAKGFGTGGGVFVFPDQELCQKVRNCGGPFIFSGPHQIPVLGASIASAKILLSDELTDKQEALTQRITYCQALLERHNLPVVSDPDSPVFFIGVGMRSVGYNLVQRVINDGCYVNISAFPAVPETCTGLRFTITLHHSFEDIEKLVDCIAFHLPLALVEEGSSLENIHRAFRRISTFQINQAKQSEPLVKFQTEDFSVQQVKSIQQVRPDFWNRLVSTKEIFSWQNLLMLEKSFTGNAEPENNWDFHYYLVKDKAGKPILSTFFTTGIFKDDMLASANVSYNVERNRKRDKYYLTSLAYIMGSLVTEGQNLYIDRSRTDWQDALKALLVVVAEEQDKQNTTRLILKDFKAEDYPLSEFFEKQGFLKVPLPDSHAVNLGSMGLDSLIETHQHVNDKVLPFEGSYKVNVVQVPSLKQIDIYYDLYRNVADKSHEISGFPFPKKLFRQMAYNPAWEFIELYVAGGSDLEQPIGLAINYKGETTYYFLLTGINYKYLKQYQVYSQILWQVLVRANQLKYKHVSLGMTASNAKAKFGASGTEKVAFVQMKDNLNSEWKDFFFPDGNIESESKD